MAQPATDAAALAPQSSYQEPPTYLESMATEPLSSAADADADESPSASQQTSIEVTNDASTKTTDESNVDSKRRSVVSDAKRDVEVGVGKCEDNFELPARNQSPNVVSISMLESGPNSVYLAMNPSPCGRHDHYAEDEDDDEEEEEEEEDENLSLTSPGTPCSQCLRDEEEATLHAAAAKSARVSSTATAKKKFYNGSERPGHFGDPDQPSSEECCSVESGSLCCNSSCCEEHQLVGGGGGLTRRTVGGKRISLTEEAAAKLGQHRPSETSAATANGSSGSDGGLRQLVTYVTPGLETVPLEMCQDIPDVMI